jgi:hypothetical protein
MRCATDVRLAFGNWVAACSCGWHSVTDDYPLADAAAQFHTVTPEMFDTPNRAGTTPA